MTRSCERSTGWRVLASAVHLSVAPSSVLLMTRAGVRPSWPPLEAWQTRRPTTGMTIPRPGCARRDAPIPGGLVEGALRPRHHCLDRPSSWQASDRTSARVANEGDHPSNDSHQRRRDRSGNATGRTQARSAALLRARCSTGHNRIGVASGPMAARVCRARDHPGASRLPHRCGCGARVRARGDG